MKTKYKKSLNLQHDFPVDTGRKLNVNKTFRRGPGRLLNVLCAYNLRPVSMGLYLRPDVWLTLPDMCISQNALISFEKISSSFSDFRSYSSRSNH